MEIFTTNSSRLEEKETFPLYLETILLIEIMLRDHPTAEGLTVKGPKRTSARLFVPDLVFDEHIEMGENIFFYMGELSECYVIYWPDRPVAEVRHG